MPKQAIAQKMAQAEPIPQNLLDGMRELSLPLQLAFYRRYHKITQGELASALGMKQAYFSRLEEDPSQHLLSHYARITKALGARLVVLPPGAKIVTRKPLVRTHSWGISSNAC